MEKLHAYLADRKKSDFARKLNISAAYLSQILSGLRRPGLDLAFRIEAETGGEVPASMWIRQSSEASSDAR